jgi:LAO/AO transport system kinase
MVKNRLVQEILDRIVESGEFDKAVQAVAAGEKDPYTACDDLLLPTLSALK